ncbi:DUF7144 family membrane protein [Actinomycetospora chiangmaiensis]|uniref:DUF7144 family membrane protein n=1 Tax=Actinomycetospora chiangmaiensis TaxID=402650 RepID=UPI00036BE5F4|nr:hypothetical protein [Actinomycetospora chiangmaiensis]
MTESRFPRPVVAGAAPPDTVRAHDRARPSTRWEGWVGLGAVLIVVVGAFSVIQGLLALLAPSFFVERGGRVLALDLAAWGWLHLVLGALVLLAGSSLLSGAGSWAGSAAVVLVAVNMLVQLVWLPAFPLWSIVIVAFDLLVLYAVATTWIDLRTVG